VLVLLPPSEGKAPGGQGSRLSLTGLSWHRELGPTRRRVLKALVDLCRADPPRARALLGLSEALDTDRRANTVIRSAPTLPAGNRYAGVLYGALGYPSLPAAARHRADAALVTFSGLWGAVRPVDEIPAYRIGVGTRLPGQPGIPAIWRDPVGSALAAAIEERGALDLRSAGYDQMARLPATAARRVLTVKVKAPSFQSKQIKGLLVRAMLLAGSPGPESLVTAARLLAVEVTDAPAGLVLTAPAGWQPPAGAGGR
jgi:cytoplasmic iron level regulating protein YaaA (DUF328/UPF0246 family)